MSLTLPINNPSVIIGENINQKKTANYKMIKNQKLIATETVWKAALKLISMYNKKRILNKKVKKAKV